MDKSLAAALGMLAAGCTISGDVLVPPPGPDAGSRDAGFDAGLDAGFDAGSDGGPDASEDAGPGPICQPGEGEDPWLEVPPPAEPHVVDGDFTGAEWDAVVPLEGLYTDLYLDQRGGSLFLLNDWYANRQGITEDCFNLFRMDIDGAPVEVRVFGDGRIEVDGLPVAATGGFGFLPSPRHPFAHTIYELELRGVDAGTVHVCPLDPLTAAECDQVFADPVVFTLVDGDSGVFARRSFGASPIELGEGEACGTGAGVCAEGLFCSSEEDPARCRALPVDAGTILDAGGDAGPGPS